MADSSVAAATPGQGISSPIVYPFVDRQLSRSRAEPAMTELHDQIQEATRAIRARWDGKPRAGIILGTGLGGLVEEIETEMAFPYGDVPHFPTTTVQSHAG